MYTETNWSLLSLGTMKQGLKFPSMIHVSEISRDGRGNGWIQTPIKASGDVITFYWHPFFVSLSDEFHLTF